MPIRGSSIRIHRRTFVGAGLAAGVSRFASPFIITARAADVIKIGLDNPLTGPLAALGKNELIGCQMAVEDINGKGGILGRAVALAVEDFDEQRRRHSCSESAQAYRRRQSRFPAGQYQLRPFARIGASLERERNSADRSGGPHGRGDRRELPLECLSRL